MMDAKSFPRTSLERAFGEQIQIELTILLGIEDMLRAVIRWRTHEHGNDRKLATLRHHLSSFERQLARTRLLMDQSGYLHAVSEEFPELTNAVNSLRDRRATLQDELGRLLLRLEVSLPSDVTGLDQICLSIGELLDRLERHGKDEISLVQRSINQVDGGSG